jgi:hypothetical protein
LVKLFLSSFLKNDSVEIKHKVDLEKVFDQWFIEYFTSKQWKQGVREINSMLEEIVKEEDKYLV